MLTIRQAQMRALQKASWSRLIVEHVYECFPDKCKGLTRTEVRQFTERAAAQARKYGFSTLTDVQQFVDLAMVLGENFESRPEFSWTLEILNEKDPAKVAFRATWLYDRVTGQLRK